MLLDPIHLPFTEEQLLSHFAPFRKDGLCIKNVEHLKYYKESIRRYKAYLAKIAERKGRPLKELKWPCQIEKDERFWIASARAPTEHT